MVKQAAAAAAVAATAATQVYPVTEYELGERAKQAAKLMAAKIKEVPNLGNATPEGLIDMLGDVREQKKRLEFLEGVYKAALEARISEAQQTGSSPVMGETWLGQYSEVTQERISAEKVREVLKNEPTLLAKCFASTSFKMLKTSLNPKAFK